MFPPKTTVLCQYAETGFITSTVTPAYYSYRLNSIFDPNFTGTGGSVKSYSTLAANYGIYRVMSVDYTLMVQSSSDIYGGCIPYAVSGSLASFGIDDFAVQSRVQLSSRSGYADAPMVFKGTLNMWEIAGVTKETYSSDDSYASAMGTNPVEINWFSVFAQNVDEATSAGTRWLVRFNYTVELSEPKTVAL